MYNLEFAKRRVDEQIKYISKYTNTHKPSLRTSEVITSAYSILRMWECEVKLLEENEKVTRKNKRKIE